MNRPKLLLTTSILLLSTAILAASPAWSAGSAFDDQFTSFNTSQWFLDGVWANGGIFLNTWDPAQVTVSNGVLNNKLESRSGTIYSGEMRSQQFYSYGQYDCWMKPVAKSGVVSAFFTYTGPPQGNPHDEIDIEFTGNDPHVVGFTIYSGSDTGTHPNNFIAPGNTQGKVSAIHSTSQITLGFDPTAAFHKYSIVWATNSITWLVDDVTVAIANAGAVDGNGLTISIPNVASYIMSNMWPANAVSWVGAWDPSTGLPQTMPVDEIKYSLLSATPPAPTGLTATAGNAQVTLNWAPATGATSYSVYRGTTAGGESGTAVASGITSTTYTNTGLTNGTTYYFKVKATNSAGTSGYSNEASATPASSGSTLFSTGFETGNTLPTWSDTPDTAYNNSPSAVTGYNAGGNPECSTRQEISHTGSVELMYSGTDNSATASYDYFKVFAVNIPITSATKMSYWIYPQQDNGRYVGIDFHCTDGSDLRDSGATDYNGFSMHPNAGHGGNITINAWTDIKCNVGQWLAGKTVDKIWVAYDRGPSTGQFRGYMDDILITNGTLP